MKLPVIAGLALTLAVAAIVAGGGERPSLRWERSPLLVADVGRTGDHVVIGTVRNTSLRTRLELRSADLRVIDGSGRPVRAHARFAASYAHGLYGAYPRVARQPDSEQRRLGYRITLDPGRTSPLFVAFRGGRGPLRIVYGKPAESLPVPARGTRAPAEARLGS